MNYLFTYLFTKFVMTILNKGLIKNRPKYSNLKKR